jgi:hypothetical protein
VVNASDPHAVIWLTAATAQPLLQIKTAVLHVIGVSS